MTPLAARLAKQLIAPSCEFWRENRKTLRGCLEGIHCFDTTEVLQMIPELQRTIIDRFGFAVREVDVPLEQSEFVGRLVFLPAPKTWIEWIRPDVWRVGLLLEEISETSARVELFTEETAGEIGRISTVSDDWKTTEGKFLVPSHWTIAGPELCRSFLTVAHVMLILINSPRIIGRKQLMPNAALERRLTKGLGVGTFPLHAWTELKLRVAKPIEIDDGEPHEAHLTGRRALHFVRKHIRIRLGQLEYVSAHWRGDPAIGIKQTRYTVTP